MSLAIYTGYGGHRFVADKGFGEVVVRISMRSECYVTTCAREAAAQPLLDELGLMSQTALWNCSQNCVPSCNSNCNPANPPGFSTHERRNDGVAYSWWPRGFKLPMWARGIDVNPARTAAFCEEARKEGFTVTLTYPGSPRESQHVNFRKAPKINWWIYRPIARGSKGRRANEVVRLLSELHADDGGRYLPGRHDHVDKGTDAAIKAFQRDHHQPIDGVVGIHTIQAMRAQKRRRDARLKETS